MHVGCLYRGSRSPHPFSTTIICAYTYFYSYRKSPEPSAPRVSPATTIRRACCPAPIESPFKKGVERRSVSITI